MDISRSENTDFEVDLLKYPPIVHGVHQWTIEVLYPCKATWLGVALATTAVDTQTFLGNQRVGWVYGSSGSAIHAATSIKNLPKFQQGSQVKLTLNLLPNQDGNGTLDVSIGGGESFRVFDGMIFQLDGNTVGFVPAVSLRFPGRIRLVDIQKVEA